MKELVPASSRRGIQITINGSALGFVQKMVVTASRPVREAVQFAPQQGNARLAVQGSPVYRIHLIQLRFTEGWAQTGLFELSNFSLTISQNGGSVHYLGCHWTELEQTIEPFGLQVDALTLTARERKEIK